MILDLLMVALLAALLGFVVVAARRKAPVVVEDVVASRVRSRVVVTLKSGAAFDGVLVESDARGLVLREAVALDGSRSVSVDGEVVVLVADIAYIQRP